LAPIILTCANPARARMVARRFDRILVRRRHREYLTVTGIYRGLRLSVMATGIGPASTAIAVVEAAQCVAPATFIRMGSCGALAAGVDVGDLVITSRVRREEDTTRFYAPEPAEIPAHPQVVDALVQAAAELGAPHHVGLTATIADFYAGQGRQAPGFPLADPGHLTRLAQSGVLTVEMEMSVYLALSHFSTLGLRAGGVCAVFDSMVTRAEVFSLKKLRQAAEHRMLDVGLRTAEILAG
jgi:uridine phosphorylase